MNSYHSELTRHLKHACYHGFYDDVLDALASGADPLDKGESGKNSLHYAAMGGHAELCSYLSLQYPECLCVRDNAGQTALHLACRNAHASVVLTLCYLGADLNLRDEFGRRPIDCCSDKLTMNTLKQFQQNQLISECAMQALSSAFSSSMNGAP